MTRDLESALREALHLLHDMGFRSGIMDRINAALSAASGEVRKGV